MGCVVFNLITSPFNYDENLSIISIIEIRYGFYVGYYPDIEYSD